MPVTLLPKLLPLPTTEVVVLLESPVVEHLNLEVEAAELHAHADLEPLAQLDPLEEMDNPEEMVNLAALDKTVPQLQVEDVPKPQLAIPVAPLDLPDPLDLPAQMVNPETPEPLAKTLKEVAQDLLAQPDHPVHPEEMDNLEAPVNPVDPDKLHKEPTVKDHPAQLDLPAHLAMLEHLDKDLLLALDPLAQPETPDHLDQPEETVNPVVLETMEPPAVVVVAIIALPHVLLQDIREYSNGCIFLYSFMIFISLVV